MNSKMKKIYILVPFLFAAISCSDFLEEGLEGTYSTDTFYRTASHAELALTGVYNAISFNSTNNALWVYGDVVSDDAVKGGLAGDLSDVQFLEEFNYVRANEYLDKIWRQYYEGINRSNFLIYYVPRIEMDETRKNEIIAEGKFLRAWLYFNLTNIFGAIPLRVDPMLSPEQSALATSTPEEIYTQIEIDLNDAIGGLKVTPAKDGAASKGSAYGLLAKVKLFQGEWQASLDAITSLEALNQYSLQHAYRNNFIDSTQNNSESIFEIQHLKGQSPSLGSFLNQYFSPAKENGYYFDQPTDDFVDEFEVTEEGVVDPRLDYTVGREGKKWLNGEDFDPAWSSTGYLSKKHVQPLREVPKGTKGDAGLNYVYMRFAEVLLMKAEALNELGQTADALAPLNDVRKRARESYLYDEDLEGFGSVPVDLLPDVTSNTQSVVREAIRHERRVELGMEFHRYFDLARYGKATAEEALAEQGFNYESDRYFLIPQSEFNTNPLIE
jgi:hypothetical protein